MREIKFKIWDVINKRWYPRYSGENIDLMCESTNGVQLALDDKRLIALQYTGIKDKTGREIYEGDIVDQEIWVKVGEYDRSIGVIEYLAPDFRSVCVGDWAGSHAKLNSNAIILGNKYENPELLINTGQKNGAKPLL